MTTSQRLAVLIFHRLQAFVVLVQRFVIFVARVLFDHGDDRVRRDEARQVIDVPVGVVADDPVARATGCSSRRGNLANIARSRSRLSCGLRLGLSRHASVVISVPRPLTSIEPPSITMPG